MIAMNPGHQYLNEDAATSPRTSRSNASASE